MRLEWRLLSETPSLCQHNPGYCYFSWDSYFLAFPTFLTQSENNYPIPQMDCLSFIFSLLVFLLSLFLLINSGSVIIRHSLSQMGLFIKVLLILIKHKDIEGLLDQLLQKIDTLIQHSLEKSHVLMEGGADNCIQVNRQPPKRKKWGEAQSLCGVKSERSWKCLGDQGRHHGGNGLSRQWLFSYHFRSRRKGNRWEKKGCVKGTEWCHLAKMQAMCRENTLSLCK